MGGLHLSPYYASGESVRPPPGGLGAARASAYDGRMTSPAPRSASYLMIETQEGVGWDAWQALAARAEAAGLGGLVVSDHYLSPSDPELGCLDAWAVLAALAQATRRLRLGTLVSPVTFRHPAVLARLAQTVDQISGGRVDVGLGAGWSTEEHAAFAFPFPDLAGRLALLEEQTAIVRALLDGEVVDGAGPAYPLVAGRLRPRPVQARVPLVLGGAARPRMARLAARCADEYNLVYDPPAACAGARERLDAACAAVGRDPRRCP